MPQQQPWPHIIYNSLASSDLDITALSGTESVLDIQASRTIAPGAPPEVVNKLIMSVATQINDSRSSYQPPFRAIDLHKNIADVIIETSAQGASLLEVHVIDPFWTLLQRNDAGWSFIDTSDDGYLWPPIEINFPPDVSDATWRLASVKPSIDTTQANLIMIFEDKIVAEMREHTGSGSSTSQATDPSLSVSGAQETRAEFIERCVKTVSKNTLLPSEVPIRFRPLLPQSDFTTADLVGTEVTLPASATNPASPARANPTKNPAGDASTTVAAAKGAANAVQTIINITIGALNGKTQATGVTGGTGPDAGAGVTGSTGEQGFTG